MDDVKGATYDFGGLRGLGVGGRGGVVGCFHALVGSTKSPAVADGRTVVEMEMSGCAVQVERPGRGPSRLLLWTAMWLRCGPASDQDVTLVGTDASPTKGPHWRRL